jgi:hypothetical protein
MNTTNTSDPLFARRAILAVLMAGVALVFILSGHEPGWQPFAITGLVAIGYLIASLTIPQGSHWLGILTLATLIIAISWERDKPLAAIVGVVLAMLSAMIAHKGDPLSQDSTSNPPSELRDTPEP